MWICTQNTQISGIWRWFNKYHCAAVPDASHHKNTGITLLTFGPSRYILLLSLFHGNRWSYYFIYIQCVCNPQRATSASVYPSSHQNPFLFHPSGHRPAFRRFLLGQIAHGAQFRSAGPPLNILISASPLTLLLSHFLCFSISLRCPSPLSFSSPFSVPFPLPLSFPLSLWLLIGCLSACGSCVLCVIEQRGQSEYSDGRICLCERCIDGDRSPDAAVCLLLSSCIQDLTGDLRWPNMPDVCPKSPSCTNRCVFVFIQI